VENYAAYVGRALLMFPTVVVPVAQEEQGKAQACRLAAYLIALDNPHIGLLEKLTGNQVGGYSVDAIVDRRDGSGADGVSSTPKGVPPGMLQIIQVWTEYAPSGATIPRWRPATLDLAMAPGPLGPPSVQTFAPPPPPPPKPGTTPVPDDLAVLAALEARLTGHIDTKVAALAKDLAEFRTTFATHDGMVRRLLDRHLRGTLNVFGLARTLTLEWFDPGKEAVEKAAREREAAARGLR
jgi:hypothetical protein